MVLALSEKDGCGLMQIGGAEQFALPMGARPLPETSDSTVDFQNRVLSHHPPTRKASLAPPGQIVDSAVVAKNNLVVYKGLK